jgi:hypothetical protein
MFVHSVFGSFKPKAAEWKGYQNFYVQPYYDWTAIDPEALQTQLPDDDGFDTVYPFLRYRLHCHAFTPAGPTHDADDGEEHDGSDPDSLDRFCTVQLLLSTQLTQAAKRCVAGLQYSAAWPRCASMDSWMSFLLGTSTASSVCTIDLD